ncbi:hypothetical protein EVAR_47347_1 [Eumeta japonica]|uniref:Uncharacterized protein n=1 Tax=Eumeta variegata TaxID=151549 RepID=A0A4C1WSX6_EUMVA|nr:hypothetical protein EVAR_47347_1 [Eumeta japonica]
MRLCLLIHAITLRFRAAVLAQENSADDVVLPSEKLSTDKCQKYLKQWKARSTVERGAHPRARSEIPSIVFESDVPRGSNSITRRPAPNEIKCKTRKYVLIGVMDENIFFATAIANLCDSLFS